MKDSLHIKELRELLAAKDTESIKQYCEEIHPADLAEILEELDTDEAVTLLAELDVDQSAEILSHTDESLQADVIENMPDVRLASIVTSMPHDERVDLLQLLPPKRVENVLRRVAHTEREDILRLSAYKEGTAGAIMTSDYARLTPNLTVRQALDKLRLEAPDKETIYYAYVIDQQRKLLGVVSLKDLILAKSDASVGQLMYQDLSVARTDDDQEDVARQLAKYDLIAIPVVDAYHTLVGIVTFDDAMDVTEEETTTDFHMMAPISAMEEGVSEASIWTMYTKRAPWLLILVFMNIFSGAGIAHFESTIEAIVALVFFLPLLIDSGGNAGSQSSTLMVRALATGEVEAKDWLRLLFREVSVALIVGLTMAVAVSIVGLARATAEVAAVVAVSMVAVVLVGSLMGMSLPFLLTRFKLDPATASAPLVTSIADVVGVVVYLGIATWLLAV